MLQSGFGAEPCWRLGVGQHRQRTLISHRACTISEKIRKKNEQQVAYHNQNFAKETSSLAFALALAQIVGPAHVVFSLGIEAGQSRVLGTETTNLRLPTSKF